MAQHFLAQALLRHHQQYQPPPGSLWLRQLPLYLIGEHQECLDEPVAAAFDPLPTGTLWVVSANPVVPAAWWWTFPVWLRRAPDAQRHPGVLQSTPEPGNGWYHGLWVNLGQFVEGANL